MSKRQVKSREKQRRHQHAAKPTKGQVAAGAGLALGAALGVPAQAQANDFTVTNLGDTGLGSLRQAAIDAAGNPGHDRILFASGLSGEIDLTSGEVYLQDVDVVGPGPAALTVNQTTANSRVFYAGPVPGGVVSLSGLTVTGGNVSGKGGGIFAYKQDLNLSNMVITGNQTTNRGGGVALYQGGATIKDSTITGNKGSQGGGMFLYGGGWTTYTANNGSGWTIANTVVSGNQATSGRGGGIKFYRAAAPTDIINSTISGNTATSAGGGLNFYKTADTNLIGDTISGNTSAVGFSSGGGGGVFFYGLDTTSAGAHGTGHPMKVAIANTTISGNAETNASGGGGGGVFSKFLEGGMSIDSSTISGNSAATQGGGLAFYPEGGSSIGPVAINSTILGDNTAPTGPDFLDNRTTQPASLGFDLLETAPAGSQAPNTIGPNIIGQDAGLQPLASNGGPTQTEAITASSPALDKGNTGLKSDQRGVLRPIDFPGIANAAGGNGADIGAFELQPSTSFKFGKLKRNRKKGTAVQTVKLALPAAGSVTVSGKGLKKKTAQVGANGVVKLKLITKGKIKRKLSKSGKRKVKASFTYNATGTTPATQKKTEKLLKKLKRHH